MSFFAQRVANQFPAWSKISADPSSFGHRLFGSYVGIRDNAMTTLLLMREMHEIFTSNMGLPHVNEVNIRNEIVDENADILYMPKWPVDSQDNLIRPTFQVEIDNVQVDIVEASSIEDFFHSVPEFDYVSTVNVFPGDDGHGEGWIIFSSENLQEPFGARVGSYGRDQAGVHSFPELFDRDHMGSKLSVNVADSTRYRKVEEEEGFFGLSRVKIIGKDINNFYQEEIIVIDDDGWYTTSKTFSDVTRVAYDGFDGKVVVRLADVLSEDEDSDAIFKWNPYRVVSLPIEPFDGPMLLNFADNEAGLTFVQVRTPRYLDGRLYRRGVEATAEGFIEENDPYNLENEPVASFYLKNTDAAGYKARDMAVSPHDALVYVLEDRGNGLDDLDVRIHVHDIDLTPFEVWTLERTAVTSIDILPLKHRVFLDETMPLWTWHRFLNAPVQKVTILRDSPAERALGVFKYLQDDLTWGDDLHFFSGSPLAGLPEDTWDDIKFNCEFDELGQWNFYCEVDVFEEDIQRSCTAIMVEHNQAVKSFTLPRLGEDKAFNRIQPHAIFFDNEGDLCLAKTYRYYDADDNLINLNNDGADVPDPEEKLYYTKYRGKIHKFWADYFDMKVFFREDYSADPTWTNSAVIIAAVKAMNEA